MREQKIVEERRAIWRAWCLFSREQNEMIRLIVWGVLWYFSVVQPNFQSVELLGHTCLLFSVSLFMEYYPMIKRFPRQVEKENFAWITAAKIPAFLFLALLGSIILISFVLAFGPPKGVTVEAAWRVYRVLFIIVGAYLVINCAAYLLYTSIRTEDEPEDEPKVEPEVELEELKRLWQAARTGNMGNAEPPPAKEAEEEPGDGPDEKEE